MAALGPVTGTIWFNLKLNHPGRHARAGHRALPVASGTVTVPVTHWQAQAARSRC